MKNMILSFVFVTGFSMFATAENLTGSCELNNGHVVNVFEFQASSGNQLTLGFKGLDNSDYKIQVVNNEPSYVYEFDHLLISVSRDEGGLQNPPQLGEPLPPAHTPVRQDAFHRSTGASIDQEWMSPESYSVVRLKQGAHIVVNTNMGGVEVRCHGFYN